MKEAALEILPSELRRSLQKLAESEQIRAEEIRLRIGRRPSVLFPEGEKELSEVSPVTKETFRALMERATGASPYAFRESVSRGYISYREGVRIGLCGEMSEEGEAVVARTITSASIRIPHEVLGCGEAFTEGQYRSTIILSPPGLGKTTLLRDMIRALSEKGLRVGAVDDRGELAAFYGEGFGFDVGRQTDVITHGGKQRAVMMLLRTMNPQVIAMDEISEAEDTEACLAAANSGVLLLASAHAYSAEDLYTKTLYRRLMEQKIFSRAVVISVKDSVRQYKIEELT